MNHSDLKEETTYQSSTFSPAQAEAIGLRTTDYPYENAPSDGTSTFFCGGVWNRNAELRCLFVTNDSKQIRFSVDAKPDNNFSLSGGGLPMMLIEIGTHILIQRHTATTVSDNIFTFQDWQLA